jgi:AcrR family transcriptional regulator
MPASRTTTSPKTSPRGRAVAAAFALFDERGYESTTVEQIAERAGISRSTFFRMFASKEDVIFPDHEPLQARIRARLSVAGSDAGILAVTEAARMVLEQFLAEGELARSRYRLTRTVPALRDREIAGMHGYQRIFREFIRTFMTGEGAGLRSELMANAIVTAHNVVLRRWLRNENDGPEGAFDRAMAQVVALFAPPAGGPEGTTLLVLRSSESVDALLPRLRSALGGSQE